MRKMLYDIRTVCNDTSRPVIFQDEQVKKYKNDQSISNTEALKLMILPNIIGLFTFLAIFSAHTIQTGHI